MWGTPATVDERVAEIPSPTDDLAERGAWLSRAMAGTWADLGPDLAAWRDRLVQAVRDLAADTVVVTHFVAINAVVGRATGDDRVMSRGASTTARSPPSTPPAARLTLVELGAAAGTEVG